MFSKHFLIEVEELYMEHHITETAALYCWRCMQCKLPVAVCSRILLIQHSLWFSTWGSNPKTCSFAVKFWCGCSCRDFIWVMWTVLVLSS